MVLQSALSRAFLPWSGTTLFLDPETKRAPHYGMYRVCGHGWLTELGETSSPAKAQDQALKRGLLTLPASERILGTLAPSRESIEHSAASSVRRIVDCGFGSSALAC